MTKKSISKAGSSFEGTQTLPAGGTYKLMVMDSSLLPYINAIVPAPVEEPVE